MNEMKKSVRAIISGEVQGVGYRYTVYHIAQKFKLVGFVRNLGSGEVEVHAEGEEGELEKFLKAIEISDGWIRVGKITVSWGKGKSGYKDFSIIR